MSRVPYNKLLTNLACSSHISLLLTERKVRAVEYWREAEAIIGDGDRKRAPFLVLGLAP